jgi:hypothetical protein
MAWRLFYIHFEIVNAIPCLIACRSFYSNLFVSQHDIAGGLPPACRREAERRLAKPPASRSTLFAAYHQFEFPEEKHKG